MQVYAKFKNSKAKHDQILNQVYLNETTNVNEDEFILKLHWLIKFIS